MKHMGSQFHETGYEKRFFEHQLPEFHSPKKYYIYASKT
jgi:hypothetical protein